MDPLPAVFWKARLVRDSAFAPPRLGCPCTVPTLTCFPPATVFASAMKPFAYKGKMKKAKLKKASQSTTLPVSVGLAVGTGGGPLALAQHPRASATARFGTRAPLTRVPHTCVPPPSLRRGGPQTQSRGHTPQFAHRVRRKPSHNP